MTRRLFAFAFCLLPLALCFAAADKDVILQAMRDELARSREMKFAGLEAPYFISYALDDGEVLSITATLGGMIGARRDRYRLPEIEVRVGGYQFDNTNYAGGFMFGSRYDVSRYPIENDYTVLRRYLWLSTDSTYKAAVEAISRKRAALKNMAVAEQINDFARAETVQRIAPVVRQKIDDAHWQGLARSLSGVFTAYPQIKDSNVEVYVGQGVHYLVTSEGAEVRLPEELSFIRVRATAQAPDGMSLHDAVAFHSLDLSRFAPEGDLRHAIAELAEGLTSAARAPMGEDYNGPMVFEGVAAAQLLAEVLGKNLALARRPVMERGRGGPIASSELEGRQGSRVLPEFMDVVDDPTQTEYRGRRLFGHYEVDREGVAAKPLRLVEKGILKSFLLTRQPVRGFEGSNGRARLPGVFGASMASFSNLFIRASETVPVSDLKKKMIEMCRNRSKPYGILVRKIDFPSTASLTELRQMLGRASQSGGGAHPVSLPILVYRVYLDGREELIRGVRFSGLNARSLKDIMAAGDDATIFDFLDNTAPLAMMGAGGTASETCIIAPSILIDDLELRKMDEELPKLPIVPAP